MKYLKLVLATLVITATAGALFTYAEVPVSTSANFNNYTQNLSRGMCDQRIQDLQIYLMKKGYVPNDYDKYVTGYFGPATFKAVKKMQLDNGIRSTGFVGPQTRVFLNAEYTNMSIAAEAARQEEIRTNPNYRAMGLIPTAKCVYDKIPKATFPLPTN